MKFRLTILIILTLACSIAFSQKRFITIDSTKIWISTIGLENRNEGQPVIVFESRAGTPVDNWDRVPEGVAKMAPLITYDRTGIGKSEADTRDTTTLKGVSYRLLKILTFPEVTPHYILAGYSLGEAYVRSFAVYYPELVAGLIIIDPADFTETKQNRKLPFTDIGLSKKTVDSLFIKWAKELFLPEDNLKS